MSDFLAIPEAERHHELIAGEISEKAAPTGEHGGAQAGLIYSLYGPFNRRPGGGGPGGWWFAAEVEIQLGANIVRPDVVGWRRERAPERPSGSPIGVEPDWICEILSTNRRTDVIQKKRLYHERRIPYYWIIDPIEGTLLVYRWTTDGYTEVLAAERGEQVRAEPFQAMELPVGVFLGDDEA